MSPSDLLLIFAYNADSGFLEALKDGMRKVVSPSTYPCRLCALTYGLATMRPRWRSFVEGAGCPGGVPPQGRVPRALQRGGVPLGIHRGGELEIFIGSDEMYATEILDDLMALVGERLEERSLE